MQKSIKNIVALLLFASILSILLYPAFSLLISTVVISFSGQIGVETNTAAASGSATDIQTAVNWIVAHGGIGNVTIPAGTFNWVNVGEAWKTVNVPAGINIIGSANTRDSNGQNTQWNTVLIQPFSVPGDPYGTWTGTTSDIKNWFVVTGSGSSERSTRISDLKLQGYRTTNSNDHMQSRGIVISNVVNYRVDHCYFDNICGGALSASGMQCCGVMDHCYVINNPAIVTSNIATCDVDYGTQYYRSFSGSFSTLWDSNVYNVVGKYTTYSHFVEDCHFERWRHVSASNDGAHYVFRYNTVNHGFGFGEVDAHGTYNVAGTRAVEVYGNSFTNANQGFTLTTLFLRGGAMTYFNNYMDSSYRYVVLTTEGSVPACYPANVYIWNNNLSPSISITGTGTYSDGHTGPALGTDYFTSAMPNYTPYTYPHPLTEE